MKILSDIINRINQITYQSMIRNSDMANKHSSHEPDYSHIRLRDLMVPFHEIKEGLRIVRILDYDVYFAVKDGNDDTPTMVQLLKKHEVTELQSDPSSASKLDSYTWKTLDECDTMYPKVLMKLAIFAHKQRNGKS